MQIRIKKYLIAATALAFTGTLSLPIQAQSAAANYPIKPSKWLCPSRLDRALTLLVALLPRVLQKLGSSPSLLKTVPVLVAC